MKIAVTVVSASGRVSPMFDASERIVVLECCRNNLSDAAEYDFPTGIEAKIAFLAAHGIRMLICGAISNDDILSMKTQEIGVCPFVSGNWHEVLDEWLRKRLLRECHLMPGCRGHHRWCCGR